MSYRKVTVLNKGHFPITVAGMTFNPFEEVIIDIESTSLLFCQIRATKNLRVGKQNNEEWVAKNKPTTSYDFNMVYDVPNQHKKNAYTHAIEALASPIIEHLEKGKSGFVIQPTIGLNLRFFSSMRINQQGKSIVGPADVFMSHGIGDKDYWIGENIKDYQYALVPGHAWKERMRLTGYKGEIFEVGYTKLDPLFNGEYKRNKHDKPYVVWAPTHGYINKYKGRSSFPECLTLINDIPNKYDTQLALHPTSRMGLKKEHDVTMQELLDADVVIADAGSTLYEAWALGKPVIFPDWLCKDDIIKHFNPNNLEYRIYNEGIGYHANSMEHLIKLIDVAIHGGMRQKEIEFIEDVFPEKYRGKSGINSANVLRQIHDSIYIDRLVDGTPR